MANHLEHEHRASDSHVFYIYLREINFEDMVTEFAKKKARKVSSL